jgi:endonuclease YncB( thermonuclease family)
MKCADRRWQRVLLATAALSVLGLTGARSQGLDMDSGSGTPAPAVHQSGGLDMDVNPNAPIPSKPAGAPRDTIQDGIAPLSTTKTTTDTGIAPASAPSDMPPPATTVVEQQPPPPPVTLDHPTVVDTAKLQSGGTTVSLYGIEGIAGASAQGLQGFLATGDGHVTCQPQNSAGFVCLMGDGTNVAQVALVNGAAKTTQDAPDSYREQEAAAQAARRGIWYNLPPPPDTLKHPVVQDTATLFGDGKLYVLDGVVGFDAPYAGMLQGYIAANGDSVTCSPQNDLGNFVCLLPDGTDVAKVALVNGAARVGANAPDAYRVQQLDALNNRRGYWATAPEAVLTAALLPPEPQEQYVMVAGDDGGDGISYVGGAPVALIDGESVFLVYGDDDLGWGYYDHYHHWRGAPDRFRNHMEHFHPGGHGLRGGHDAFHHDMETRNRMEAMHHDPAMRREEAMHPGSVHPAMAGGHPGPGGPMGGRPGGMAGPAGHPGPGGPMGGARPAMAGPMGGARPGMAGPMGGARPGNMAMAGGARPGMGGAPGGGFMHPGAAASAGGFHPGGMAGGGAMHASAPAPHPSGGGGGRHK